MMYRPRWYLVAAVVLLLGVGYVTVKSLLDPTDDVAPPPAIGPSMPEGYTVDWVPVGDQTYLCIRYVHDGIACDFSRPSPRPTPSPDRS